MCYGQNSTKFGLKMPKFDNFNPLPAGHCLQEVWTHMQNLFLTYCPFQQCIGSIALGQYILWNMRIKIYVTCIIGKPTFWLWNWNRATRLWNITLFNFYGFPDSITTSIIIWCLFEKICFFLPSNQFNFKFGYHGNQVKNGMFFKI